MKTLTKENNRLEILPKHSVTVPYPEFITLDVHIIGESPLLVHRRGDQLKKWFGQKTQGEIKTKKKIVDLDEIFVDSIHWHYSQMNLDKKEKLKLIKNKKGKYVFPSAGIKRGCQIACTSFIKDKDNLPGRLIKGAFQIKDEYIEILGDPIRHEAIKVTSMGSPQMLVCAMFPKWESKFQVLYNSTCITGQQVMYVINYAGFSCGLGYDRPGKSGGNYGRYKVKEV